MNHATRTWYPLTPVPSEAPPPPNAHPKRGPAIRLHTYRNASGEELGHAALFGGDDGRRLLLPLTFCQDTEGKRAWRWLPLPTLRPLFNLHALMAATEAATDSPPMVLLCYDEHAADCAAKLLPEYVCVSWHGGIWKRAETDFSPLRGHRVAIWADHGAKRYGGGDSGEAGVLLSPEKQPVLRATRQLVGTLRAHGAKVWTVVKPPAGGSLPDGWNAADALAEEWTPERAREWFDANSHQPTTVGLEAEDPPASSAAEPAEPTTLLSMVDRFTLIYPTETAWDATCEKIVKVSAMRTHFSKPVVDFWLSDPRRRTVNEEGVVFDPSEQCDPNTTVNLFRGFKTKPSIEGSCGKLLELLQYLCGEAGQDLAPITDWVIKWIAYPLQHPGAKMRTAVVMYGRDEGTGKNLFWSAVQSIYGPYSASITQWQLQTQFNDWISRKMFVVANEVVTQAEKRHLVGYLKTLITEPKISIEAKNMPVREEDNRMQLVLFSNELEPLRIMPSDRRYMVIRTPGVLNKQFYDEVADEIAAGGAERLYHYLLNEVDLTDFTEHTKPLDTDAKRDLVEMGLSSPQLFQQELHDGLLPAKYGPCASMDLYRFYQAWCGRVGEKMPAKLNIFSNAFASMNGVKRYRTQVAIGNETEARKRQIFVMGENEEGLDQAEWVRRGLNAFRDALGRYLDG